MNRSIIPAMAALVCLVGCGSKGFVLNISEDELTDKIKGGWAGQVIGCTYGGPTEFAYAGTMMNPDIPLVWREDGIKDYFDNHPGLYDDVYMDLTWLSVFDSLGLDAPVEEHAKAFSNAKYPLWHANQQARYNILQGMDPGQSGYWENNPHADDIDFQIEADYAGLMTPGLPNTAAELCDGIGHLMNYGDGWYGGVFVAAMYSLAFVSNDVELVIKEALKVIPAQSRYHKCMSDVITWHKQYPQNWELTWALIQKNYSFDLGCPDGVYAHYNIDAVINSAYILVGLLYGEKDFSKTIEIATRCGQDSDCNPASAGGILGVMLGYSGIPNEWKTPLLEVEDRNFAYCSISLNKACEISRKLALEIIEREGGTCENNELHIPVQEPRAVRFEECFSGHWPNKPVKVDKPVSECGVIEFEGKGIVVKGNFHPRIPGDRYVAQIEATLDGNTYPVKDFPMSNHDRSDFLFFSYNLPSGKHELSLKCLNPVKGSEVLVINYYTYSERPEEK